MAEPGLFVVCKQCGNEVSPYVTECPYCGTRLRKRAPRIEREGGELRAPSSRGARGTRKAKRPRAQRERPRWSTPEGDPVGRPWGAIALVAAGLLGYLALVFVDDGRVVLDASFDEGDWWRVFTAPFAYGNGWYQFAVLIAVGLFGWLLERRHGRVTMLAVFFAGASGGMAVVGALDPSPLAAGANGGALALLAAWAVPDLLARRRGEDDDSDMLGALTIGLVVALMPLAVDVASAIAGTTGLLIGALAGLVLSRGR